MIPITPDAIPMAFRTLDGSGLVVMPTDTVAAKGRPQDKPIVVMLADSGAAMRLVDFPQAAQKLAEAFWPGPLTLVLPWPEKSGITNAVTAGLSTIGLRVPDHPAALAILRAFGRPLAVTSANPSGAESAVEAWEVEAELGRQVDLVLDDGAAPIGVESTILEVTHDGLKLLRPGALGLEEIAEALGIAATEIAK